MGPTSSLRSVLTAPEAARLYRLSHRYIVYLASREVVKARRSNGTWLIDKVSLRKYLSKERKPGRKPRKRTPKDNSS